MAILVKGAKDQILVRVIAEMPGDLGQKIKVPFVVAYRRLAHDDGVAFAKRLSANEVTDDDLVKEMVVGWRELKGADDEEIPYSVDAREEIMRHTPYREALIGGFLKQQYEIDVKNRS